MRFISNYVIVTLSNQMFTLLEPELVVSSRSSVRPLISLASVSFGPGAGGNIDCANMPS